uniref:C-C motif chemokine n=1 Tax=Paramormyrops kingsleyae TaxID=1676925 RepID=A0A3B3S648_9TELE
MYIFRVAVYIFNRPEECCFTYFPGKLKMELVAGYVETRGDCSKPGIIFYTRSGTEVCVDPKEEWVQEIKKKLDHPPHQKKPPHQ